MAPDEDRITPETGPGAGAAGSPLQLVAYLGDQVRMFDLPAAGEVTIGRGESSAVRVDDPSVSRQHAVLRVGQGLEIEETGLWREDL